MTSSDASRARLSLILSMLIWGSVGLFRKYISMPSGLIAEVRAVGGMIFLLLLAFARKTPPSLADIRKNALPLLLSGLFLGLNWILLFEAYNYTSVAAATLCYYMAPMMVMLLSPALVHERLTAKKLICLAGSVVGMAMVSGVSGTDNPGHLRGVLMGLGAAVFYAGVMLTGKRISGISAMDRTIAQLGVSAVLMLPYVLLTRPAAASLTGVGALMLAVLSVVHTGAAYALYFGSMDRLPAQTVALMSYIDPVCAVLLSALILREPLPPMAAVGAALILGAVIVCELPERKH